MKRYFFILIYFFISTANSDEFGLKTSPEGPSTIQNIVFYKVGDEIRILFVVEELNQQNPVSCKTFYIKTNKTFEEVNQSQLVTESGLFGLISDYNERFERHGTKKLVVVSQVMVQRIANSIGTFRKEYPQVVAGTLERTTCEDWALKQRKHYWGENLGLRSLNTGSRSAPDFLQNVEVNQ